MLHIGYFIIVGGHNIKKISFCKSLNSENCKLKTVVRRSLQTDTPYTNWPNGVKTISQTS